MADPKDIDRVMKVLEANESLDFVQRIFSPEKYPAISEDERLGKGEFATHQMSYTENDEGTEFYVYPNIVHREGKLDWLEGGDAAKYAANSGEFIKFDKREDAEWFSENYKLIWPEK